MNVSKRILVGISSATLMIGAGGGIAAAANRDAPPAGGGDGPPGAAAIATYLGLTSDQIRTQLQSGKTLAQIATTAGKTVSGLEDAIVADAKTHLDADVAAGKLTAAQEATKLADIQSHVDEMVNSSGPPNGGKGGPGGPGGPGGKGGPGGPGGGPASQAIATYLGLTSDQIRTQLQSGKTLAQIATTAGKTVSGLEDAIVADTKTHLDADVTAGKLTAAQETSMLADIQSHVADMVNSSGPPKGGPRGDGGSGTSSGTGTVSGPRLAGPRR